MHQQFWYPFRWFFGTQKGIKTDGFQNGKFWGLLKTRCFGAPAILVPVWVSPNLRFGLGKAVFEKKEGRKTFLWSSTEFQKHGLTSAREMKVPTSTVAALFSKIALTGQRIPMVDMVLLVFFISISKIKTGGWSQSFPLKIFFACSLGGGGRYF